MKTLKHLSAFFLLSGLSFITLAQTGQGAVLIGGDSKLTCILDKTVWKTDDDEGETGSTRGFELSSIIGYFVIDELAIGIKTPWSYYSRMDRNDNQENQHSIVAMPFVRYYILPSDIMPYIHTGMGLGYQKEKFIPDTGPSYDSSSRLFLLELKGGVGIFLNEKTSIDIGIGYARESSKPRENNDLNYRSIQKGLFTQIGIVVIL